MQEIRFVRFHGFFLIFFLNVFYRRVILPTNSVGNSSKTPKTYSEQSLKYDPSTVFRPVTVENARSHVGDD